ncbi:MAG: hypothetical protein WCR29_05185 [Bacteroidales bacterium]|nr:hypothetical protein [Bacteroidales bacterium]
MKVRVLFILIWFFSINAFSQEIDSIDNINNDYYVDIEIGDDEYSEDEESKEIEVKDEISKQSVEFSEKLLSDINILRDRDSLVYHFSKIIGENEILPFIDGINKLNIDRMFEVIFYPNTEKIMYVREMILNENQAWDYIYENVFDENGVERLFIRHYSTFKSVCAEVAFELSEYFYDENNELIKKTYSIFDGQNNPLDIDDCWMEREDYLIYKNFDELNSKFNLPLESIKNKELKSKESVNNEEISNSVNQKQESF